MKPLALALLLLCSAARADDACTAAALLHTADYLQTRQIAKNPDRWHETNPALGLHPSVGRVNSYFAITGIALYGACESGIGGKWLKYGWIAVSTGAIANNLSLGIQVKW